jgi:hypothetical protein
MPSTPINPAKNDLGDSGTFTDFARRILSVPHSEIKAKLDAEREAKRTSKVRASRAVGASESEPED